jgi:hypothetical protein
MTKFIKKATLAAALGATALVASSPADAQRYRHRYHDDTGTAIVAGIAGIAIGAAIAGGDRYDRRYDYDRRYYRSHGYYPTNGYYYRENYRRYRGYDNCYIRRVYDPYEGRTVRVRYCN